MIRFFHKLEPEKLNMEDWAKYQNESLFLIELFHKMIWGDEK